ncbi:MAG: peptidylprolyl isomerase [Ignavibacteriales bacterium]|nr:peptidylprolyl isomerase [Ignavibacteriales bacterium]
MKINFSNKIIPFFLLSFVLNSSTNIFAQSEKDIVAKAGSIKITKEEFIKRYELGAHPNREGLDSAALKTEFLHTLLAEKLLAQSASAKNLEKEPNFAAMMEYLKKIYLRDILYRKEVKEKIVVADSDMAIGRERVLKTLKVKFIFSNDEKEIADIYKSLAGGAPFDSILQTRTENNEQKETAEVTFGKMDPAVEDAIYKLFPGEFTQPIELQEGWYICKVYDIVIKGNYEKEDESTMKKVVETRAEDKLYDSFYRKFFKGVNINADRALFSKLAKLFYEYLSVNQNQFQEIKGIKYRFGEPEIVKLSKNISGEDKKKIFIKFEKDPVTFGSFILQMRLNGIDFNQLDEKHVVNILNNYVYTFIQNELLSREAQKRGYDKLPEAADELKMWKEYYLSREEMKTIFKQQAVADDEAEKFFEKANRAVQQPDSVKILEILTSSLENVEQVLNEVNNGADFKELAEKYTLRDSLKTKGGEFNYFPVTENGELGRTAAGMKIGDVFGPITLPEGYSIIKLIDRKEGKKKTFAAFDEAKEEIKNILRTEKMYSALDEVTSEIAVQKGVGINESVLKSLKVTNVNMVVLRRFGFGGQLLAVPDAQPYSSWFKKYQQKIKSQLP